MNGKVYPQLLGKVVAINANMAFRVVFRLVKPLLPRSVLEKQTICPASGTSRWTVDINQCPFISKMNAVGQIPTFLGGRLEPPRFLIDPDIRPTASVKHKVSASSTLTVVAKETTKPKLRVKLELPLLNNGKLTIDINFNDSHLEDRFILTSKHGLVRKEYETSGLGQFIAKASNDGRHSRVLEVNFEADEA